MHLGQLIEYVRRILQDEAGDRWNTDEIVTYLDEAHREFASRLGLNRGAGFLSPLDRLSEDGSGPSYAFFALPAEALELTKLKLNGTPLTGADLDELPDDFEGEHGDPCEYLMGPYGYNVLRLYPAPRDPVNLYAYFTRTPRSLAETQAPEIPEAYHVALANFAIARCYLRDDDANQGQTKASLFQQLYETTLKEASSAAARQFSREPVTIRRDWL